MPKLMDTTMENLKTSSGYGFSALKVDELGAPEYTLVTVCQDASGSVSPYKADMEKCLQTMLDACKKDPHAENLMLRLLEFSEDLREIHGFRLLSDIDRSEYNDCLRIGGYTALFDAVQSAVEATVSYARILHEQDFLTNAIIFVGTDGRDNASRATMQSVKKAIQQTIADEVLESITVVLVGVGTNEQGVSQYLEDFQKEVEIDQYIDIGDATPSELAKLAKFMSKSVSSTSQALGSGAASQLLTF